MLMLESGAIREFVGRSMLMAVMDMLIEFDVSICTNLVLEKKLLFFGILIIVFMLYILGVNWLG